MDRQIHIYRVMQSSESIKCSAVPLTPDSLDSTDEEPCDARSVDSIDSDRESYSIKNSFIHFEDIFANSERDTRVTRSMPEGKFAEEVRKEVEAAVQMKSRRADKARPPPILSDVEDDCLEERDEGRTVIDCPSTPEAETDMRGFHQVSACTPLRFSGELVQSMWTVVPPQPSVTVLPCAMWTPTAPPLVIAPRCIAASPAGVPLAGLGPMPAVTPEATELRQGPAPPRLTPGASVILCNLARQPSFNGRRGVIDSFDADCGRYNVLLDTVPDTQPVSGAQTVFKVKAENVCLAAPQSLVDGPVSATMS
jgi:hypothetical protein